MAGAAAWMGAALAGTSVVGCSKPQMLMRAGAIVFPGYELMFMARDQGLLDPRRVRLVEMLATTDTLRALASGQLEAGAMTLDEMMSARADGLDLRAVVVLDVSQGADVVMARPGITLEKLKGKRVAAEEGAMGAVMLSALLQAAQLEVHEIQKVPMTLDRSVAVFRSGKVDAVVTAEPWATQLEAQGAKRIFDSARIPGRIVDVLAVRADAMDECAAAIRTLVAAHFEARRYFAEQPVQAGAYMSARMQTPAHEVPLAYRGLSLPDVAENRRLLSPGGQLHATAQELQRVLFEAGLIRKLAPPGDLMDTRFLPA